MNRTKSLIIAALGIFLFAQAAQADWTSRKRLSWSSGNCFDPAISTDSCGNIHVVWQDEAPGNYEIYYKKSTDEGVTWTSSRRLTWNSGESGPVAIAVEPVANIHVVWKDDTPGNSEIYYEKSTDWGVTWTSSQRLSWNSGESRSPKIAVASGNLHLIWSNSEEIYYKKSTDGGATWTASKRLSWTSGSSNRPAIAVDSSGSLHVVWYDRTPGNLEIFYKRSTDEGATWSTNKRLSWTSGASEWPDIAIGSSGNLHVVWQDYTPGTWTIYYKNSGDGGVTWTTSQRLTWTSGAAMDPAIAIDSFGSLHVAWDDWASVSNEIYYRKSDDGGATWTPSQRITWNSLTSVGPVVAVDWADNLHVVWQDDIIALNFQIYYKKYVR